MGQNLLRAAYLPFLRNTRNTVTNVIALAIGTASVLFVANLVLYEMSYDESLEDVHRLELKSSDSPTTYNAYTSSRFGLDLQNQNGNKTFVRLIPFSEFKSANLRYSSDSADHAAYFRRTYFADHAVLDLFEIDLLVGEPEDFNTPGAMIISKNAAQELFGSKWKSLSVGTEFRQGKGSIQYTYRLIGVYANRELNTHIDFDALIAISTPGSGEGKLSGYTYVSSDAFNLPDSIHLRKLPAIHTTQGVVNEAEPVINGHLLLLLSIVVGVILLITITNYINSTIIHFVDRCKDVGIRKLLGARLTSLSTRLVIELLSVNIIAMVLGLALFLICARYVHQFNLITYPPLEHIQWSKLTIIACTTIVINTLLSSVYPVIFLNRIEIISALKGAGSLFRTKTFGNAGNVVRSLLIFQIIASLCFLSASQIIYRQLPFINTEPKGEVPITGVFPGSSGATERFAQTAVGFLEEMVDYGTIISYSFSNMYKGHVKSEQKILLEDSTYAYLTVVDPKHLSNSEELITGEFFNPDFGRNAGKVILDSSIANSQFGFNDSTRIWTRERNKYETIGIVKGEESDFSRVYVSGFRYLTYVDLVLNYEGRGGERFDQFLEKTEYIISTRFPFFFLMRKEQKDTRRAEEDVLALFLFFGVVSVLVVVIGLFGLSYFITRKKSREVGIRKIHGASPVQILIKLLTDFMRLIAVGGLLAAPIIYYGGNYWLENYAYRINLDLTVFILPVFVISFISLISVLDKSWKAATLNPIEILDDK